MDGIENADSAEVIHPEFAYANGVLTGLTLPSEADKNWPQMVTSKGDCDFIAKMRSVADSASSIAAISDQVLSDDESTVASDFWFVALYVPMLQCASSLLGDGWKKRANPALGPHNIDLLRRSMPC